jgi:hypothetical protein
MPRTKQTVLQTLRILQISRKLCKIMEIIVAQFAFSKKGLLEPFYLKSLVLHVFYL